MQRRTPKMYAERMPGRMVHLGYGKWVRADRVYAVVPLEAGERGDGRRTYVHVEGLGEPLIASRSERAILGDLEGALSDDAGIPGRRAGGAPGTPGSLRLRSQSCFASEISRSRRSVRSSISSTSRSGGCSSVTCIRYPWAG
jgi:hypothetical protein